MSTTEPSEDVPADRFVLRPDGGVWVYLEGRPEPIRCRRPKLKDDSAMWEAYLSIADGLADWAAEMKRFVTEQEAAATAEGRGESDEERDAGRKRRSEFQHASEERWVGWWKALIARMADVEDWLTETGEAPIWMADSSSAAAVINHWRSMPVPSSPR